MNISNKDIKIKILEEQNKKLLKELMDCRYSRVNLDCRYTMGNVCDISGRHCETKICARCEYEKEIEKMEEYIKKLENEISDIKEENMWLREDLKDCKRILDKNDMKYGRDNID